MADIISNKSFRTANDWLDQLLMSSCSAMKKVKRMVEGKEVEEEERDGVDVEKLCALARENGFEPKVHGKANPGLFRMTIGNAMRARARRRHGLMAGGKFIAASAAFCEGHTKTENPDGSKYESPEAKAAREKSEALKAAKGNEVAAQKAHDAVVAHLAELEKADPKDAGAVKTAKVDVKVAEKALSAAQAAVAKLEG